MQKIRMQTIIATAIASLFLPTTAIPAPETLTAHELNITQTWLRSIGNHESGPLQYTTSFPFHFDTANVDKPCTGKYRSEASLERWVNCMKRHETLLMKLLTEGSCPELVYSLPMSYINQMRDSINSQGSWVPIHIMGIDDNDQEVGAYLLVLIKDGEVSRLLADILYME